MEALLRRDMAAAVDVTPVSWSVADSLTEQIIAVADETIKSEHRVRDELSLVGIWNALVTPSSPSAQKNCGARVVRRLFKKGALHSSRTSILGRGDGVRMARSCAAGCCLCGPIVRDHW